MGTSSDLRPGKFCVLATHSHTHTRRHPQNSLPFLATIEHFAAVICLRSVR